jgi:hypothetical protein
MSRKRAGIKEGKEKPDGTCIMSGSGIPLYRGLETNEADKEHRTVIE